MKSICDDCEKQDRCTTQWKNCPDFLRWVRTSRDRVAYRAYLQQLYREATFLTKDEQRERDRSKEITVTATHRRRSVCGYEEWQCLKCM